jgi:hypothetical protein
MGGGVRVAAMEERAREADDAAGGNTNGIAGIVAEVADEVVRLLVADVLDDLTRPGARVRQEVDRAVRLVHVVERDPTGQVRLVRVGMKPES